MVVKMEETIWQRESETLRLAAIEYGFKEVTPVWSEKYEQYFPSEEIKARCEKHWYEGAI